MTKLKHRNPMASEVWSRGHLVEKDDSKYNRGDLKKETREEIEDSEIKIKKENLNQILKDIEEWGKDEPEILASIDLENSQKIEIYKIFLQKELTDDYYEEHDLEKKVIENWLEKLG